MLGHIEVAIRVHLVAERATSKARHPAHMTGGKRYPETIGRSILQAVYRVGPEVVIFALLSISDHRRSGRLKLLNRVLNRFRIKRVKLRVGVVAGFGNRFY